jgi:outer membrane autotransporter protein
LKVTGDVAFAPGSFLEIETDFGGTDLLDVMGSVTVDPTASLDVFFAPGAPDVQDTTIVSTTGTVDANFQVINAPNALVTVELVGGNTLVLNGMGSGALNTVTQAAAEEGFSFQRAVAGESRIRPVSPDSRLWARGMADCIERDGDRRNAGYQQDITGVAFGGDTGSFGEGLRLGLAGGYLGSDVSASDGTGNSAEIDSLQALAYGTYDLASLGGGAQLFFGLQGGYQSQDIERSVVVAGTPTKAKGDTSGYLLGGYLGLSREFPIDDNWMARPSGGVRYLHQSQESYRDSQGQSVDDLSFDTLRTGPQVELLGHYQNVGGVTFQPRGLVGWTQQIALDERQARLSLPSGASGNVDLEDGNEGYVNVGIGLDVIFQPGLRAFVGFDGAYGDAQSRSSAFAGVSIDLP